MCDVKKGLISSGPLNSKSKSSFPAQPGGELKKPHSELDFRTFPGEDATAPPLHVIHNNTRKTKSSDSLYGGSRSHWKIFKKNIFSFPRTDYNILEAVQPTCASMQSTLNFNHTLSSRFDLIFFFSNFDPICTLDTHLKVSSKQLQYLLHFGWGITKEDKEIKMLNMLSSGNAEQVYDENGFHPARILRHFEFRSRFGMTK
ncbi:hypothetical protein CEXT_297471 [Caerostris extrusa]|uniref:Uncharacterized protein n=1 Tax=Caerostris extrusa TaxID=172846 RepID=A0AAV4MEV0_CAEEX|nr:hypothetical protein CEXT_297471 [Caerostris extrusa]